MTAKRRSPWAVVLIAVAATLLVQALAVGLLAQLGELEVALGNVVLRAQRGVYAPFPAHNLLDPGATEFSPPPDVAGRVRNVVVVIGDGMGVGQVSTASQLLRGPAGGLTLETADAVGLHRTTAGNSLIADSASAASGLATGLLGERQALSWMPDGRRPTTLLEAARRQDLAVGVVTTSGLVDATPAAYLAHVPHRRDYPEILRQMLVSGAEVLVGGDWTRYAKARRNEEYLRLLDRAEAVAPPGVSVVRDAGSLAASRGPVVALLPPRPDATAIHGPPLAETATLALERLAQDADGFVLVVEHEGTDEAGHANDIAELAEVVRELDDAVRRILEVTSSRDDTLLLLTADHDVGGLAVVSGPLARGTARVRWASHQHTSQWVPLFAWGPGAEAFDGVLHGTEIARRIGALLGLAGFPDPDPPRPPTRTPAD